MESEVLKNIFKIDKDKLLKPFIESNFKEFSNGKWLDAGNIPLSDEWICENRKIAGVEEEAERDLLEMADVVRNDETLKFLFFHCSNLLYGVNKLYPESIMKWPDFSPLIPGGKGSMFLLLLGFHAIDKIIAIHRTMNIPEDITFATCADVGSRVLISKNFNDGEIGISNQCINWLCRNFVAGRIFQIGRMQFHLIQFGLPFRVYRNRSACEYKIIAEPGLRVAPDGFLDGTGCNLSDDAWETEFQFSGKQITANQVDDNTGKILKTSVTFSADEWEIVLNADSLVMNIHIPRGSRLSTDIWFDSIARAFEFFEKQMKPKVSLDACVCFSWMFEPRLRDFLPEHSGLITLQNAVHLFPLPTTATDCGLYFVFGKQNIDINSAPTDTSLRRGIVEHLKNGGVLTGGSMVFFKDELGE